MKKGFIILILAFVVSSIVFIGCETESGDAIAKVGKYTITVDELDEAVAPIASRWKSAQEELEGKKSALENLINKKLMVLGAYKEGFDADSSVLARVDGEKDRRLLMALWKTQIENKVNVTDAEIKELYDKRGIEYSASHILVTDSSLAFDLHKQLVEGADFAELAKENSEDPGSGSRGGDLGWFTTGRMVKPFEDAILTLEDGELSQPIQTRYGWHIIKRTGTRERDQEPLEIIGKNLRQTLEREKQQELSIEFVENSFTDANFKVNPEAIALIAEKAETAAGTTEEGMPTGPTFTAEEKEMNVASWDGGSWNIASFDSALALVHPTRRPTLTTPAEVEDFIKANLQSPMLILKAEKLNMEGKPAYKEIRESSLEDAMISVFQNQHIFGSVELPDEEVKAYYDANPDSFMNPRTIKVLEVQLTDQAEANEIANKVKGGADIEDFIEQSTRTYTKRAGGVLDITEARFPNLFQAVNDASSGDIVGPVKDRTGRFSIMVVQEVLDPQPIPFENVQTRIKNKLYRARREKAMEDFLESARSEFGVKVYESKIEATIDSSRYSETPAPTEKP